MKRNLLTALCWISALCLTAQTTIPYSDFDSWTERLIKESGLIGGQTRSVYVVGPQEVIPADKLAPYRYGEKTVWTSSNVYAKVAGIVKASNTVEPEKRGNGFCARLDTKLQHVKVLGMINVSVLVSGSIFTGETIEPIKSSDDPYCNLSFGSPFTGRPKALVIDYKCTISPNNYVMRYPGIGSKRIDGKQDKAEIWVYLQKRWEDAEGRIHALRVGTMRMQLDHTIAQWQNNQHLPIHYGDISKTSYYKDFMRLNGPYRARNSKGKIVPIEEEGWADADETPTHIIVMLTAGNHGAFIGTVGNSLWVDNVSFEY